MTRLGCISEWPDRLVTCTPPSALIEHGVQQPGEAGLLAAVICALFRQPVETLADDLGGGVGGDVNAIGGIHHHPPIFPVLQFPTPLFRAVLAVHLPLVQLHAIINADIGPALVMMELYLFN